MPTTILPIWCIFFITVFIFFTFFSHLPNRFVVPCKIYTLLVMGLPKQSVKVCSVNFSWNMKINVTRFHYMKNKIETKSKAKLLPCLEHYNSLSTKATKQTESALYVFKHCLWVKGVVLNIKWKVHKIKIDKFYSRHVMQTYRTVPLSSHTILTVSIALHEEPTTKDLV